MGILSPMIKQMRYRKYYRIAGITIQLESDVPITENTFRPKFKHFEVSGPGKDTVVIRHQFSLPDFNTMALGKEVYRRFPWAIYKKGSSWIYLGISRIRSNKRLYRAAVFNSDHTRGRIYNYTEDFFRKGNINSLTLFSTDQIFLARLLADRQGCFMHSCGVNLNGNGLLFVGNSEAGKSTMASFLKGEAEILCDDRIIIRCQHSRFKIHGTWINGDVQDVSSTGAPLKAVLFLRKSKVNKLVLLKDKKDIIRRLLACLVRPLATIDWWEKTLVLLENISNHIPCYEIHFDKSGNVVQLLKEL